VQQNGSTYTLTSPSSYVAHSLRPPSEHPPLQPPFGPFLVTVPTPPCTSRGPP
jgi:hypothetical protein